MSVPAPFAAVLLAGGRSQRMGRDKALLPLADGQRLWQRQLGVLRALRPAELFISGPAREGFPVSVTRLEDQTPGLGPLGGIAAALAAMRSPRLLVLAVDLPMMTADFLGALLAENGAGPTVGGVVPQTSDGYFEPLAAVYPRSARAAAGDRLQREDRSLQTFVRVLMENGQVKARPVEDAERGLFVNWNLPGDVGS